jgi:hypothetical protein
MCNRFAKSSNIRAAPLCSDKPFFGAYKYSRPCLFGREKRIAGRPRKCGSSMRFFYPRPAQLCIRRGADRRALPWSARQRPLGDRMPELKSNTSLAPWPATTARLEHRLDELEKSFPAVTAADRRLRFGVGTVRRGNCCRCRSRARLWKVRGPDRPVDSNGRKYFYGRRQPSRICLAAKLGKAQYTSTNVVENEDDR